MFLYDEAVAQAANGAAQAAGGNPIAQFIPLILIVVVFYFLMIRPQQKKMKDHRAKIEAMKRGDKVVVGGIMGVVTRVQDGPEVEIEIADGVRIKALRGMVADVMNKNAVAETPVQQSNKKNKIVKN